MDYFLNQKNSENHQNKYMWCKRTRESCFLFQFSHAVFLNILKPSNFSENSIHFIKSLGKNRNNEFFCFRFNDFSTALSRRVIKATITTPPEFSNISKTQINENDEKLSSKQNLLKTSHWLKVVQTGYLGLTQAKMWWFHLSIFCYSYM